MRASISIVKARRTAISSEFRHQQRWDVFISGVLLSFSAAVINSSTTFAFVLKRTTHMSGRANDLLHRLIFEPTEGLLILSLIACFTLGGFLAGLLFVRLGAMLELMSAALILVVATVLLSAARHTGGTDQVIGRFIVGSLIALSAGIQNGMTSQCDISRTTHITGTLTDFGLALACGSHASALFMFAKLAAFSAGGLVGFLMVQRELLIVSMMMSSFIMVAVAVFQRDPAKT